MGPHSADPSIIATTVSKPSSSLNLFRSLGIFALAVLILSELACERPKDDQAALDRLKGQADSLFEAHQFAWDTMIAEDDKKIRYMNRILEEIAYNLPYDELKMAEVKKAIESLPGSRYDKEGVANSDGIDRYDQLTDSTWTLVMSYVSETDQAMDLPLVNELFHDIQQFDHMILQRRNYYDDATSVLNEFIAEKETELLALGEPYSSWKAFPLFVIVEAS